MENYNPIKEMVRTLLFDGKTRLINLIKWSIKNLAWVILYKNLVFMLDY